MASDRSLPNVFRRALGLAAAAVVFGCGESSTATPMVSSITVTPSPVSLRAGESRTLVASVVGAAGDVVRDRVVFWSSKNAAVATVTSSGIVTGVASGTTEIAASSGGASAVVVVTVTALPASVVRVSPPTSTVQVGGTVPLTGEAFNAVNQPIDGATFSWRSGNAAIATVDANGVVTGVSTGTASIIATVDGVNGSALVSVQRVPVASVTIDPATGQLLVGQSMQLDASTLDALGNVLVGRVVTWSSSAPSVLSVSSTGTVTAVGTGSATITATSEGKSGTARVTSSAVPVFEVSVFPGTATLAVGRTASMLALVRDSSGNLLSGRVVTWSSDAPAVATVANDGTVSAVAVGTAHIKATVEGKFASSTVTVVPVPVASLTLAPLTASVRIGDSLQLVATAKDAAGNVLTGRTVSYFSGGPTAATVDASGLVTGIGVGTAVIVATSEGQRATTTLTITAIPVAAVIVSPPTASVPAGDTVRFSASIQSDRGVVVPGKVATWTSSAPNVATVSNAGLVTGVTVGTVTIRATSDGVTGQATVSITPVPVAAVIVSPTSASMAPGDQLQLTATARDSKGGTITGRATSWSSSNNAVATVSSSGLATAVANGTAVISAVIDGVTGAATLNISVTPVATVNVSPDPATVAAGGTQQLTATALGAQGKPIAGATFTWSVKDPTVATVSTQGMLTGLQAGATTVSVSAAVTGQSTPASDAAAVNVTPASAASVSIAPLTGTIHVGSAYARAVTAQAFDGGGSPIPGAAIAWSTSDASMLTAVSVSTAGVATLTALGAPTTGLLVIATVGSGPTAVADTITIDSDYVPIASVAVSPSSASITVLQAQPLSGTPQDSAGNAIGSANGNPLGTRAVAWSFTGGLALLGPASGPTTTFTPLGTGNFTVTGAVGGQSGTSAINVAFAPVDTLESVPAATAPTLKVSSGAGQTVNGRFRALASNGRRVAGLPFTVASSDPNLGTVAAVGNAQTDNQGVGDFVVTLTAAAAPGTSFKITVSAGGKSLVFTVNVT